jgi:hypothetical protein
VESASGQNRIPYSVHSRIPYTKLAEEARENFHRHRVARTTINQKLRLYTMEATANPRITCGYLNSYVGKNVIIVGRVVQLRGEEAIVDADGNITAHLNRVSLPFTPHLFPIQSLPPFSTHSRQG